VSTRFQAENLFEDWGELVLKGTPEMVVQRIIDDIGQVKSKGYSSISVRVITEGKPDFTDAGRTPSYRCTIYGSSGGVEIKMGYIKLQSLPEGQTLFRLRHLPPSREFFNRFMQQLSDEFQRLGFMHEEEKPVKKTEQKDTAELPSYLFDKMQLHPRMRKVSKSLFNSGHYGEAILAAFKAVNNFTKKKTGLSIDGKDLMAKTFNKDKPIIKLNKLSNKSERDEQEGFMYLFMGAIVGIRNPKAHEDIRQIDPYKALEYLSFASLLMRRATEGKLETENK